MNDSARPGAVVFVDTNVIIEAHRTAAWAALAGAYRVETVEDCVTQTQTGYQQRPREQWIDVGDLRDSLVAVHEVEDRERAELALRVGTIALDRGEESLWAHALGRSGAWFLSGPDELARGRPAGIPGQARVRRATPGCSRAPTADGTETGIHEEVDEGRGRRDGGCRDRCSVRGRTFRVEMAGSGSMAERVERVE